MAGKTEFATETQQWLYHQIAAPIRFGLMHYGGLITVCLTAHLLGRAARHAEQSGVPTAAIEDAIAQNMKIGRQEAENDMDLARGKQPAQNVRPI